MLPSEMEILLHDLATVSGREALAHFRARPSVKDKAGAGARFDPVTVADHAAEEAIRTLLAERRPHDAILGEELDATHGSSGYRWVVDPIDGTRTYIAGLPVWGTIIGLEYDDRPVAGMFHQPFTRERFWAVDGKAWAQVEGQDRLAMRTSTVRDLASATMMTTSPRIFAAEESPIYDRVEAAVQLARYGCDGYAYCMLAAGNIDLVVESGLQAFDVCGLVPVIEAAGGIFTSWSGEPAHGGGTVVAAATPELHRAALELLNA